MTGKAWRRILWPLWLVLLVATAIVPPATFAYDAQRFRKTIFAHASKHHCHPPRVSGSWPSTSWDASQRF